MGFSKLVNIIYIVIYHAIHYIYTIFECCHELIRIKAANQAINFTKIPNHVSLLLGNEEPSIEDLVNIIQWSMAIGISFLSFYDYKGSLSKIEDKLIQAVKEKNAGGHVIWHHSSNQVPKNGYFGQKIHVKVFGFDDGKRNLVSLCKEFTKNSEVDEISIDNINSRLRKWYEFPDPDLGIYCGKTLCIYGYPPWQIRITEFIGLKTHRNLSLPSFINVLEQFNKCEQRLGR